MPRFVCLLSVILALSTTAHAGPLNLRLALPDLAATNVGARYSGGILDIIGQTTQFTDANGNVFATTDSQIPPGGGPEAYNFEILAAIDSNGNLVAGPNSFLVDGTIP